MTTLMQMIRDDAPNVETFRAQADFIETIRRSRPDLYRAGIENVRANLPRELGGIHFGNVFKNFTAPIRELLKGDLKGAGGAIKKVVNNAVTENVRGAAQTVAHNPLQTLTTAASWGAAVLTGGNPIAVANAVTQTANLAASKVAQDKNAKAQARAKQITDAANAYAQQLASLQPGQPVPPVPDALKPYLSASDLANIQSLTNSGATTAATAGALNIPVPLLIGGALLLILLLTRK